MGIVQQLAVERWVVGGDSFRMKDGPPQMFRDTVAFANVVNGTGSWVLTDDLEVYERLQRGLTSGEVDWVFIGRGHGHDIPEKDGLRGKTGTSEEYMRAQFKAWREYMAA